MKVIDLLDKIANGETIPEYICLYNENDEQFHTVLCCEENIVHYLDDKGLKLNDEIKLDELRNTIKIPENNFNYIYSCEDDHIMANFENIKTTLKDIIDYLNSKEINKK